MNRFIRLAPLTISLASLLLGQSSNEPPPPPPPVAQAMPRTPVPGLQPGQPTQRLYGPTADTLIARPTAEGIIEGFRKVYKGDGAPRVVIYVNRALIDTASGLKLTARTEQFEKTDASLKTSGTNAYKVKESASPRLADQQTVREIERLRRELDAASLEVQRLERVWETSTQKEIERLRADLEKSTAILLEQQGLRIFLQQAVSAQWPPPQEWYEAAQRALGNQ